MILYVLRLPLKVCPTDVARRLLYSIFLTLVNHEAQAIAVFLGRAVDDALRQQPVSPCTSCLLKVALQALAEAEMNDVTHVGLVDACVVVTIALHTCRNYCGMQWA